MKNDHSVEITNIGKLNETDLNQKEVVGIHQQENTITGQENRIKGSWTASLANRRIEKPPSCSILLIDDNELMRTMMCDSLKRRGFSVKICTNLNLENIQEEIKTGNYDCIVTDYRMPHFSGIDVLQAVMDSKKHKDLDEKTVIENPEQIVENSAIIKDSQSIENSKNTLENTSTLETVDSSGKKKINNTKVVIITSDDLNLVKDEEFLKKMQEANQVCVLESASSSLDTSKEVMLTSKLNKPIEAIMKYMQQTGIQRETSNISR